MKSKIPAFLIERTSVQPYVPSKGRLKKSFIEKGIDHLAEVIKSGYVQWETSLMDSIFHRIDARIKLLFLLFFVVIVSLKHQIVPEFYIAGFIFLLTLIAGLNTLQFYKKVLFLGFFFGFLVALPSALNVISRGEVVVPILHLSRDYNFWVYHIPAEIGMTREGLNAVSMLTIRVVNSVSLSFLVLFTTPFPEIIKALKVMRVPDSFIMIITLCYKYIFIFVKTVEDMHLAKKSRTVGQVNNAEARQWVGARIGSVFKKTQLRCEEIFKAMLGRGFSTEIRLYQSRKLSSHDIAAGGIFLVIGGLFLWM